MTGEGQEGPTIVLWVIYEHPDDHPEGYVLRRWLMSGDSLQPGAASRHATLDEAREALPPGVEPAPKTGIPEDPTIIEVWW